MLRHRMRDIGTLVVAVFVVLLVPRVVHAQAAVECANASATTLNTGINSPDNTVFWGAGEISSPFNCGGTKRVEVALLGIQGTPTCQTGTFNANPQSCVGTKSGLGYANSFADAGMTATGVHDQFLGWWTAEGHFFYIDGSTWYQVRNYMRSSAQGTEPPPVDCNENQNQAECGSPIVIPLNPNGRIRLTSVEDGVWFDLDGDGIPERVAWTEPHSAVAFLAIDRNGNGRIDDGTELFGDHTLPGVPNGFAALARMAHEGIPDDQRDGLVDTEPIFSKLLLWHDLNHNGISEPNELIPASQILTTVGLGYMPSRRHDQFGNLFKYRGFAWYVDGFQRAIYDVYLRRTPQ